MLAGMVLRRCQRISDRDRTYKRYDDLQIFVITAIYNRVHTMPST